MRKTKSALLHSAIALLLCISMLIGSTFAWFTDSVTSGTNIIQSGNLDIEMYWTDDLDSGNWHNVEEDAHNTIFSYDNWEPGYTDVKYIKLVNTGSLAMNYKLTLTPQGAVGKLAEVINVYFSNSEVELQERSDLSKLRAIGLLKGVLNGGATAEGTLLPAGEVGLHPAGEVVMTIAMSMITTAGNDYQNESSGEFTVTALATQAPYEQDSFGSDYDDDAEYPAELVADKATAAVSPVDGKVPVGGVTLTGENITAFVPAGAAMAPGADNLTLAVTPMEHTTSDIKVVNDEVLIPVDVHIEGLAEDNTVPAIISLGEVLPKYLNMGNYHLFHVEDGVNNEMTLVDSEAQLTQHNQYTYDPMTGEVTVAMATFSEVALVADTSRKWKGEADYEWYTEETIEANSFEIVNADQLYAFAKIVGGMTENRERYDFAGAYVKLLCDINLNSGRATPEGEEKTRIFYPIGYYNNMGTDIRDTAQGVDGVDTTVYSFSGTFDGNGHTISNFYQNTWEMYGDYNNGYTGTPNYYKDAMGLFGYVNGGKVMNLTVDSFDSDGEFTPTGVIAAYAVNSTFENIAITNCNPRVYNTGNGGIVGIGGNSDDPNTYNLTFQNITIDNTNKISALWGSYDVACGGLVGMFRGAGHVYMANCHVAAQMDVYNDVCGNYQYYWYRYSGMMVGTNKNMITDDDGYTVPETDKFHAKDCTVHFGNWNDYYYCELVANSLASYTHDHQFSRLEQIQNVSEIKDENGNWSTTGNFILMEGKEPTKTCYHIMKDAEGNLYEHKHDVKDDTNKEIFETKDIDGDGVVDSDVLKENNQRIYLPFNQLFTGYGWGVKHIPLGEFDGVTILDRETADSKVKFEKADTAKDSYTTESTVAIGELFEAATLSDDKLAIVGDKVQVTVSSVGETSTAGATYTPNTTDWTKGTLTFSGTGAATITITDYYFCTPTTINVTITERTAAVKFETKFNGNFLYRVGNADKSTVSLGTLFEALEPVTGTVDISFETVAGNASGIYTSDTTWTNGKIQFTGTGVVRVTITDNDYCTPTVLTLEVINATNLTSATGTTTGGTFVLLCDVNTSTYVNYWNCTVYGNGFTYSLKGAPTAYNSKQGHGILIAQNAVFDNLIIEGDLYKEYGAFSTQNYYNTAIDATNTTIQNCRISGCSAPVRGKGVTIRNSTLYGGTVANMIIMDGVNTLENVVTANYNDNRGVIGFGIVVHREATDSSKLVLKGTLKQCNFVSSNDAAVVTDSNAKALFDEMYNSTYSDYHFGTSPVYVNPGVLSMTDTFDQNDITDEATKGTYSGTSLSYQVGPTTYNGYLYAPKANSGSVDNNYTESNRMQGKYPPVPIFNLGSQAVAGEDRYLKGDINGVEARYIQGETPLSLDITKLMAVTKYGETLNVAAYCKDANGDAMVVSNGVITFNTAGSYTLVFTAIDNLIYDIDGKPTGEQISYTYEVPLAVIIAEPAIKDAIITVNKTALDGGYNESYGDRSYKFNPLNAITITDAEGTVDLTTNIASSNIVYASSSSAFAGTTTITVSYNDGRELKIILGKPSLNSPGSSKAITYANDGTIKSAAKVASKSATGGTWTITSYSFKGANGKTVTNNTVVTFTFPDKSCVTGDTLVMLADGTEKRIDQVTYEDQLLVWNFFEGKYDVVPAAIIFYHGDELFEILELNFEDGTNIKTIHVHGFYDAGLNEFVFIDKENVANYIGHRFVKVDGDNYKTVKLIGYEIYEEYTGCYSIQSAVHNNFITEGMFSLTIPAYEGWFDYFEIGENMKYDEKKMQEDIEKYGLYDYSEFCEYVTYEQFIAFNGPYLKVLVGRGIVTHEQILALIATYVN